MVNVSFSVFLLLLFLIRTKNNANKIQYARNNDDESWIFSLRPRRYISGKFGCGSLCYCF